MVDLRCESCGKDFQKTEAAYRQTKNGSHFCGMKCAITARTGRSFKKRPHVYLDEDSLSQMANEITAKMEKEFENNDRLRETAL